MTPRIRGIAPSIRRLTKPGLGVKKGQKGQKGHSEPGLNAERFQIGDAVEVRLQEDGLHGSWHPAVICGVKQGFRRVQFKNLLDDKKNPAKEWVRFGKEGLAGAKSPVGTRKVTDDMPVLRPGGPGLPPPEPSFRKTGGWPKDLWVEVYSADAWWEGVLNEDISGAQMNEQESVVEVIFPQLDGLLEQVVLKNLRECKDWNEDTEIWTLRGPIAKESVKPTVPVLDKVTAEGGTNTGQDEGSAYVEIGDSGGMEDTGAGSLIAGAQDPSRETRPVPVVQSNTAFGHLIEVVETENHFLLRVHTSAYTLEQMEISVKGGYLFLEVTSDRFEEKLGTFTCEVHSVYKSMLGFPTDVAIDQENISWEIDGEVLTVTVPRAGEVPTVTAPRDGEVLNVTTPRAGEDLTLTLPGADEVLTVIVHTVGEGEQEADLSIPGA